jgi:hypothetical protein
MTTFEWAMVSIAAGGFILTAAGLLGGCIWASPRSTMQESISGRHV